MYCVYVQYYPISHIRRKYDSQLLSPTEYLIILVLEAFLKDVKVTGS
jgi:hypothetical protein